MAEDSGTQWQVTWFPLDHPERSMTTWDEDRARREFRKHARAEANPILSSREVPDWDVVDNPTMDALLARRRKD